MNDDAASLRLVVTRSVNGWYDLPQEVYEAAVDEFSRIEHQNIELRSVVKDALALVAEAQSGVSIKRTMNWQKRARAAIDEEEPG
jgi:lipopolysaccharide biosynthesis regulator YciM